MWRNFFLALSIRCKKDFLWNFRHKNLPIERVTPYRKQVTRIRKKLLRSPTEVKPMSSKRTSSVVPLDQVPRAERTPYRPVVLVVDDESVIAETLSEILSRSGYAAMTAYDANSALEIALLTPPELLVTDVVLPGMSGIELAITIRRIFPDCNVLLFSGQASTEDLLSAARREGHQFTLLSKPVHPIDLLARVQDSLKHRATANSAMN
jgi:CheY-like chemotaxis protein